MTTQKTEIERSFGQRTATLGAIALRSIRTGTGPFLIESAVITAASAATGVTGAVFSGIGTVNGMMIRDIPGPLFGNPLAKTAIGGLINYGAVAMAILAFYRIDLHFNNSRTNEKIALNLKKINAAQGLIGGAFAYEILSVLSTLTGHEVLKSHFPESELPLSDIMFSSAVGSAILSGIAVLVALVFLCRSCLICTEEKCMTYADPNVEKDIELAEQSTEYSTASISVEQSNDPDAEISRSSLSTSVG